jgi:putative RNA 2'-phosphotransferase
MLTESSKYLSYLLRHKPEAANLSIDTQGWVSIEQLLQNTALQLDEILQIVEQDDKQRYALNADRTKIRAVQGHSTPLVRVKYAIKTPPPVLFHGTNDQAWETIQKQGLRSMRRHHVHLSENQDDARAVGGRRKRDLVLLEISTRSMLCPFYQADNGVWLVTEVPISNIKRIE